MTAAERERMRKIHGAVVLLLAILTLTGSAGCGTRVDDSRVGAEVDRLPAAAGSSAGAATPANAPAAANPVGGAGGSTGATPAGPEMAVGGARPSGSSTRTLSGAA